MMNERRWAGIAGLAFIALLIVGLVLMDSPGSEASDQEIASYLADDDKQVVNIIGMYVWAVAGVAFLWFSSHLYGTLGKAENGNGTLSRLGFAGGIGFAACLFVAGAALNVVPAAIQFGDATDPGADFVRFLPSIGWATLLIGGAFAAIAQIAATSIVSLRTGAFPAWLAWLGFLACVALLGSAIFMPMVALPIWVLAVSIVLFTQKPAEAPEAARPVTAGV